MGQYPGEGPVGRDASRGVAELLPDHEVVTVQRERFKGERPQGGRSVEGHEAELSF
jgi:hypothetical protein